ncbi:MAG: SoxR reducing system RseC family protein [Hyphomicrobiales bacterium]
MTVESPLAPDLADLVEAEATVLARDGRFLLLLPHRTAGCATCGIASSCGTATLSRLVSSAPATLRVATDRDFPVGTRVVLGIRESSIVAGAAIAYLIPAAAMVVMAAIAAGLGTAEVGVGLAAVAGLCGGYLVVRSSGLARGLAPVLIGPAPASGCDVE